MITRNYELDIIPGRLTPTVKLSQYDERFRANMTLFAREGEFTIRSGTTAELRGTKPDGSEYTEVCTLAGNVATFGGHGELTDVSGTGIFEICLIHGGKELYTANFYIEIEPSPAERGNGN